MIDITKAGATQHTLENGGLTDWVVTLDKEELYTLNKDYTVQETFEIRDVVEKMMKLAHSQTKQEAESLAAVTIERIVQNGNSQLDALKAENARLSTALEKMMIKEHN